MSLPLSLKYYIGPHLTLSMKHWLWRTISHYIVGSFDSHSFFLPRFKPLMVWTCINYTLPALNNFDEFSNTAENKKNKSLKWWLPPMKGWVCVLAVGMTFEIMIFQHLSHNLGWLWAAEGLPLDRAEDYWSIGCLFFIGCNEA